ncbi:hypothetical protein [Streptomyces luteolus]|uniref:Uncharacterized protein n=1 Tax=Streptomyces luteolus TaxID=3043615 RepID=A0ABT6T7H6_9ACTN|nr:hypothetical protein [Streptomyces sp. B-S-A12]MDI3423556.1 hypothetical protein [Streptomyces sp. B-S-A12]
MSSVDGVDVPREERFEVLRQIAWQLPEYSETRLAEWGCSQRELKVLLAVFGRTEAQLGSAAGGARFEEIPPQRRSLWAAFFRRVLVSLSPRELFLRTGYALDELEAAVESWEGG